LNGIKNARKLPTVVFVVLYLLLLFIFTLFPFYFKFSFGDYVLFVVISWIVFSFSTYHIIIETHKITFILFIFVYYFFLWVLGFDYISLFYSSAFIILFWIALLLVSTVLAVMPIVMATKTIESEDKKIGTEKS